jgi:hypothetical protein
VEVHLPVSDGYHEIRDPGEQVEHADDCRADQLHVVAQVSLSFSEHKEYHHEWSEQVEEEKVVEEELEVVLKVESDGLEIKPEQSSLSSNCFIR